MSEILKLIREIKELFSKLALVDKPKIDKDESYSPH